MASSVPAPPLLAPDPALPDPALVARFRADLAQLWPDVGSSRLGLAVSGGPDSLALLLLAAAALPERVLAATVDHGLRAASAEEAAMVALVCARLGVAHRTLTVAVPAGNLQAEARAARYAALAGWMREARLTMLATAHHADDQAETLLMRLNRGSGVAGLAGVRARRALAEGGEVLRPLLGWRRAELAGVVRAAGLTPADDPSNHNPAFDRVRLRTALATAEWLDVTALAASAAYLAEADVALAWAAAREWDEGVRAEGATLIYQPRAPRGVGLRVLARIVAELGGAPARGQALARLYEALVAGEVAMIGALIARPERAGWRFAHAPARSSHPLAQH